MSDVYTKYIELSSLGESQAFEQIVVGYQQMVYVLAYRLLGCEEDARDVTQITFIRAWQSISTYNNKYQLSTWLYRIATNICYDRLRKSSRVMQVDLGDCTLQSAEDPTLAIDRQYLLSRIKSIVEDLSPRQKIVFTLSVIEELEVEEIIAITGMSAAKIKSNLYLARKYIKSKIKSYE